MMVQGAESAQSPSSPFGRTTAAGGSAVSTPAAAMEGRKLKRKAESQDNERLSKRLSLLNIEKNGSKLYVPVESPSTTPPPTVNHHQQLSAPPPSDSMQVDESKHKVYIYNIDDELASDTESDDGAKLVFLPDIEKHLREKSRIPAHVLANSEGELAGMQVVLYSDPKSLTVPEENDSVRRAVVEARRRLRAKQRQEQDEDIDVDAGVEAVTESNGQSYDRGEGGAISHAEEYHRGDDAMDVD